MTTKVIFRKFKDQGDIIALFPELPWSSQYDFLSYMHVGQHGSADHSTVDITTLATPEEYAPLMEELQSIGYDLEVRKKITYRMDQERYTYSLLVGEGVKV